MNHTSVRYDAAPTKLELPYTKSMPYHQLQGTNFGRSQRQNRPTALTTASTAAPPNPGGAYDIQGTSRQASLRRID